MGLSNICPSFRRAIAIVRGYDGDLIWAAMNGKAEMVAARIRAGADVNGKDKISGQTALTQAALRGRAEAVRVLVAAKADVNAKNAYGETALINAMFAGNDAAARETAKILIDAGADMTAKDNRGQTALGAAILRDLDAAGRLLRETAEARGLGDQEGFLVAERKLLAPFREAAARMQRQAGIDPCRLRETAVQMKTDFTLAYPLAESDEMKKALVTGLADVAVDIACMKTTDAGVLNARVEAVELLCDALAKGVAGYLLPRKLFKGLLAAAHDMSAGSGTKESGGKDYDAAVSAAVEKITAAAAPFRHVINARPMEYDCFLIDGLLVETPWGRTCRGPSV